MSTRHLELSDPFVAKIVRTAFPEYKGRKVVAEIQPTVKFHSTNWDGGYRRQYVIVRLADLAVLQGPQAGFLDASLEHNDLPIPPGIVVVCHVNSGQDKHIEILSSAENITPTLPAPANLTRDEKLVLCVTRSYISSVRVQEARRLGMKPQSWDTVKAALIERGLLAKNGSLTIAGKNIIGQRIQTYHFADGADPAI